MYKINIPRQIGQAIKDKRLEMGLTQVQLAELTNTSRSLIYRLEKGTTNGIMLDKLFQILKALKLGLAITDDRKSPKSIHGIAMEHDVSNGQAKGRTVSSRKTATRNDPSRNAPAQLDKERTALRNIKGLDAAKYLRG